MSFVCNYDACVCVRVIVSVYVVVKACAGVYRYAPCEQTFSQMPNTLIANEKANNHPANAKPTGSRRLPRKHLRTLPPSPLIRPWPALLQKPH